MVSTCASYLLSYISEAANLLWQPVAAPSCCLTSHLIYHPAACSSPSLSVPWPPCCDTLPSLRHPPPAAPALCRWARPHSYVHADDSLCRLLPTCQPWNRRQTVALGAPGGDGLQASSSLLAQLDYFFLPLPPLPAPAAALPHERKNRAGAQRSETKKKGMPRSATVPFPSSLIALGPFRGNPAHKCHSRYPIVFGSTVRPLRSVN